MRQIALISCNTVVEKKVRRSSIQHCLLEKRVCLKSRSGHRKARTTFSTLEFGFCCLNRSDVLFFSRLFSIKLQELQGAPKCLHTLTPKLSEDQCSLPAVHITVCFAGSISRRQNDEYLTSQDVWASSVCHFFV